MNKITVEEVRRLDAERTQGIFRKGKYDLIQNDAGDTVIGCGEGIAGYEEGGWIYKNGDLNLLMAAPRIAALCIEQADELSLRNESVKNIASELNFIRDKYEKLMIDNCELIQQNAKNSGEIERLIAGLNQRLFEAEKQRDEFGELIGILKVEVEKWKNQAARAVDQTERVAESQGELRDMTHIEIEHLRAENECLKESVESIKAIWRRNYGYLHYDDMRLGFESEMERVFPDLSANDDDSMPLNYDALMCRNASLMAENEQLKSSYAERGDKIVALRDENERMSGALLKSKDALEKSRGAFYFYKDSLAEIDMGDCLNTTISIVEECFFEVGELLRSPAPAKEDKTNGGWLSIESAPDSGESILLYDGYCYEGCWDELDYNEFYGKPVMGWNYGCAEIDPSNFSPTHWKPLGELPAQPPINDKQG